MQLRILSVLACALAVSTAQADEPSAAQKAVEIRQSIFKLLGWNFSPTIGPMMAEKTKFDPVVVQKDAVRLAALATVVKSGDEATFRPAALAVSQACRACHDRCYREDSAL